MNITDLRDQYVSAREVARAAGFTGHFRNLVAGVIEELGQEPTPECWAAAADDVTLVLVTTAGTDFEVTPATVASEAMRIHAEVHRMDQEDAFDAHFEKYGTVPRQVFM